MTSDEIEYFYCGDENMDWIIETNGFKLKQFFNDIPFLNVSCQWFVQLFLWRTARYYVQEFIIPNKIDLDYKHFYYTFNELVNDGIIEGYVKLLDKYSLQNNSEYGFNFKNGNIYNPYYSLYYLSVLAEEYFSGRFFSENSDKELKRLFESVIIKYLNNDAGFTFIESFTTARIVFYISRITKNENTPEILNFLINPKIIQGMYSILSSGFGTVYKKIIQHQSERLDYHIRLIYRMDLSFVLEGVQVKSDCVEDFFSKENNIFDCSEDVMQQKMFFLAFESIKWAVGYFLNTLYLIEVNFEKEVEVEKFIQTLDDLGFFKEFIDIICLHNSVEFTNIDNNIIEEYLLKFMAIISGYKKGRELMMKHQTFFIDFIGEISLSLTNNDYANIIIVNLLRDDEYFDLIFPKLKYQLSILINLQVESFISLKVGKYSFHEENKPKNYVGEELCRIILSKTPTDVRDEDFFDVPIKEKCEFLKIMWEKGIPTIPNILVDCGVEIEKFEKKYGELQEIIKNDESNYEKRYELIVTEQNLLFYLDLSIVLSYCQFRNIEGSIFPNFSEMELRGLIREKQELNWNYRTNNIVVNDMYKTAQFYLLWLKGGTNKEGKNPDFSDPFSVYDDNRIVLKKFLSKLDYLRFKSRDIVMYKRFGIPTHLSEFFSKNFDVKTYRKPESFVGIAKFLKAYDINEVNRREGKKLKEKHKEKVQDEENENLSINDIIKNHVYKFRMKDLFSDIVYRESKIREKLNKKHSQTNEL